MQAKIYISLSGFFIEKKLASDTGSKHRVLPEHGPAPARGRDRCRNPQHAPQAGACRPHEDPDGQAHYRRRYAAQRDHRYQRLQECRPAHSFCRHPAGRAMVYTNVPDLRDIHTTIKLLNVLGCSCSYDDHRVELKPGSLLPRLRMIWCAPCAPRCSAWVRCWPVSARPAWPCPAAAPSAPAPWTST